MCSSLSNNDPLVVLRATPLAAHDDAVLQLVPWGHDVQTLRSRPKYTLCGGFAPHASLFVGQLGCALSLQEMGTNLTGIQL